MIFERKLNLHNYMEVCKENNRLLNAIIFNGDISSEVKNYIFCMQKLETKQKLALATEKNKQNLYIITVKNAFKWFTYQKSELNFVIIVN